MTAQDAAVVTVACIALERSETFTVARVAAEPGGRAASTSSGGLGGVA